MIYNTSHFLCGNTFSADGFILDPVNRIDNIVYTSVVNIRRLACPGINR